MKELTSRIYNTVIFVSIYLFGRLLLLPGVDHSVFFQHNTTGIIAWLDRLLGSSLTSYSVLALGIYPYISASIFIQFASRNLPYFQRLQKEGPSGRNKLSQITRLLACFVAPLQAIPYLLRSVPQQALFISRYEFLLLGLIVLTTGTMFCVFLADRITEKGIGNGSSVIITSGILASLPNSITQEVSQVSGMLIFVIEVVVLFFITLSIIAITRAVRKIPLQRARQFVGLNALTYTGRGEYLPVQVNAAGVMPIIMAGMLSTSPRLLGRLLRDKSEWAATIETIMSDDTGWQYNLFLAILVFGCTYFYVAIFFNVSEIVSSLKKENAFISNVKPGRDTAAYIDSVLGKVTLFGSFFLALIAVLPAVAYYFKVTRAFSRFFGGTNLIILTGTILELIQQIKSYLFMGQYNNMVQNETIPEL
ncbi:MAG: preprotein translocase subunit SecY [Bacteroidota bacterium]